LSFYISKRCHKRTCDFNVDMGVVAKDLLYFIVAYVIAISLGLVKHYFYPNGGLMHIADVCLAVALMVIYIIYVLKQANTGSTMGDWDISPLHLQRRTVGDPRRRWMFFQLFLAIVLMFIGSQFFVKEVQALAAIIAIPPLVLAMLLVPVATELPEKFNSIIWVSRGRDTLAMGNVSGAMVMQATFPVSIGLLFTNWQFSLISLEMLSAFMALLSAGVMLIGWKITGKLSPALLLFGGLLYAIFIGAVIFAQTHH
jgi:cation:H+ antiporter